jgi:hypothetical protein
MIIQPYQRQVATSQKQALRATANLSEAQDQAQLGQALGTAGQAVNQTADLFAKIQAERNDMDLQNTLLDVERDMATEFKQIQADQTLMEVESAFSKAVNGEDGTGGIYGKYKEKFKQPGMADRYQLAFEQMRNRGLSQAQDLGVSRRVEDLRTNKLKYYKERISSLGWDKGDIEEGLKDIYEDIDSLIVFSPSEISQLKEDYRNDAELNGVKANARYVFDTTEGSYLDKMEAATAALYSQDVRDLSADEYDEFISKINIWGNQAHSIQAAREDEADSALYEEYTNQYIKAMETGDFESGLEWVKTTNPYDKPLKKQMYDSLLRASQGGESGGADTVPDDFSNWIVDLAKNMDYDESYKDQAVIARATDLGLNPAQTMKAMDQMNKYQKDFQNPVFKDTMDQLETFKPEFKEGEPKDEEQLTRFNKIKAEMVSLYSSGTYTAEQMPQILQNKMRDYLKGEIVFTFKTKDGLNSLDELHPENMNKVTDLRKAIKMVRTGEFLASSMTERKKFTQAYDSMMGSIQEGGDLQGLKKMDGFLNDFTPRYSATIDGKDVDIQLTEDGEIQYWEQLAGEEKGKWVTLEGFDYYSEQDAEKAADKVVQDNLNKATEDLIQGADNPVAAAWDNRPEAKTEAAPYTTPYDDPLKEEVRQLLLADYNERNSWEGKGGEADITGLQRLQLRTAYAKILGRPITRREMLDIIEEVKNGAK